MSYKVSLRNINLYSVVVVVVAVTDRSSAGVQREPTEDEQKFSGLNRGEIPSKSFQRLQSMTGSGRHCRCRASSTFTDVHHHHVILLSVCDSARSWFSVSVPAMHAKHFCSYISYSSHHCHRPSVRPSLFHSALKTHKSVQKVASSIPGRGAVE